MVSLETETDRTLFFDLLPIDVGSIAGFNTRIQLYTVPGQVFYNTTRKLVLKGVDGVVFVADSQRAMVQANRDSFENLRENLAEMGLDLDEIPLVLQFNKRDLPDICSVDELNAALNPKSSPWFEASALHGQGVFETLKGISKLTLLSLRQRLSRASGETSPAPVRPTPPPRAAAPSAKPAAPAQAPGPTAGSTGAAKPAAPKSASPAPKRAAAPPRPMVRKTRDVMGELEKLRLEATQSGVKPREPAVNGRREVSRHVELTLKRTDFERVRRFSVTLQVEDGNHQVVESVRGLRVDVSDPASLQKVLLRLNVALNAKE
jgi:signal recognition particle receptor subunit beta